MQPGKCPKCGSGVSVETTAVDEGVWKLGIVREEARWRSLAERMGKHLTEIQYTKSDPYRSHMDQCRSCGRSRYFGCFSNCQLAALLAELEGMK